LIGKENMRLLAAGNTMIPAILLIRELGYILTVNQEKNEFYAEKDGNSFEADDPVMLLGLIKLYEVKGENWRASDEEIERVLKEIT
jgi:hypothetical protein